MAIVGQLNKKIMLRYIILINYIKRTNKTCKRYTGCLTQDAQYYM